MKNIEFETKILDINKDDVVKRLRALKAVEFPEHLERRVIFDIKSENIEWVRVRQEKEICTLAYKYKILGNTEIGKTIEIETKVDDFDKTREILTKLHFYYRSMYQETKKHFFKLNGIEYSICTWPRLKPFLEVEGTSEDEVKNGLRIIGLEGKDSGDLDIATIYNRIHLDMNSIPELIFEE